MTESKARTSRLTEQQCAFLRRILQYTGAATSRECGLADREEDRARQKCRRAGLVTFDGGFWRITPAGRAALAAAEGGGLQ